MLGRIGPRGGTCGARIYRGLPEMDVFYIVDLSVEVSRKHTGYELKAIRRAMFKPLGAERLRHRSREQN